MASDRITGIAGMGDVTVRYWAAARDAAGCATEQLAGQTLADVISAAGDRHGPELTRLLGICSYIVDATPVQRTQAGRIRLDAGAQVEVLPPFAGGSPAGSGLRRFSVPAVLVLAALLLVAGNATGRPGLAAGVIALQAVLGLAWLVLFSATADAAVLVGFAVVAADVVLLRSRAATAGSIVGVLGLSVIAVLFHQLARRDRRGVTGALVVVLTAIVMAAALALLLPLRELAGGRSAVFVGVVTAAAALAVVRLLPGPDPLRRFAALVAAAVVAVGCGLPSGGLTTAAASSLGLASAATVLLVDRMLERITVPESGGGRWAYAGVLVPVTALLPLVLASPIAYLAGRVIASGGG